MKAEHTPGPWKAKFSEYKEHTITNKSGQMFIAEVYLFDADAQTKANANLIAAAPDLLEACIECESTIEMLLDELGKLNASASMSLSSIKKAIKKATGAN